MHTCDRGGERTPAASAARLPRNSWSGARAWKACRDQSYSGRTDPHPPEVQAVLLALGALLFS